MLLVQGPHLRATAVEDGSSFLEGRQYRKKRNQGDSYSLGTREERKSGMKACWYSGERCAVIRELYGMATVSAQCPGN